MGRLREPRVGVRRSQPPSPIEGPQRLVPLEQWQSPLVDLEGKRQAGPKRLEVRRAREEIESPLDPGDVLRTPGVREPGEEIAPLGRRPIDRRVPLSARDVGRIEPGPRRERIRSRELAPGRLEDPDRPEPTEETDRALEGRGDSPPPPLEEQVRPRRVVRPPEEEIGRAS